MQRFCITLDSSTPFGGVALELIEVSSNMHVGNFVIHAPPAFNLSPCVHHQRFNIIFQLAHEEASLRDSGSTSAAAKTGIRAWTDNEVESLADITTTAGPPRSPTHFYAQG